MILQIMQNLSINQVQFDFFSKKCQPCENRLVDPVGKTACWRSNQPSLASAELWLVLLKRV
jgi:hypothetical protein